METFWIGFLKSEVPNAGFDQLHRGVLIGEGIIYDTSVLKVFL